VTSSPVPGASPEERRRSTGKALVALGIFVSVSSAFGTLFGVMYLLFSGVFALVLPAVFGTPWDDLALDDRAQVCPGELTVVAEDSSLRVNDENTVRIVYDYDPGDGPREGELRVLQSDPLAALAPGDAVAVEYLPDEPEVSRIQGGKIAISGWAGMMGYLFAAIGLVVAVFFGAGVAVGLGLVVVGNRLRARAAPAD